MKAVMCLARHAATFACVTEKWDGSLSGFAFVWEHLAEILVRSELASLRVEMS